MKSRLRVKQDPITFPAHALIVVEERLGEQQAEGVKPNQ
jgi:hypothetical protein